MVKARWNGCQRQPPRHDLLLTDIGLGKGHDGWTVADRARRLNATYITGGGGADFAERRVAGSLLPVKPLRRNELLFAIDRLCAPSARQPLMRARLP